VHLDRLGKRTHRGSMGTAERVAQPLHLQRATGVVAE
jgi:hypothetical protein